MAWESLLQSGFKSHLHKRRNVRFKGLRRVYTPPHLLTAHTAAHTAKHGALWMGALSLPLDRFARFGTSVRAEARMGVLCYFCMGRRNIGKSREPSERRHAPCASLFRGAAAPLGCVIPLLFLSPHRWVSRFCLSMITARREYICCFHTLVCSMRLATRCRSVALSTASICR